MLNRDHLIERYNALKSLERIPELDTRSSRRFLVDNSNSVLDEIIHAHDLFVVTGGYFGDEGKGKIVFALARHPLIEAVLRLNSGENAGHSNVYKGKDIVLHLTPSGIFVPGKICGIGGECVMDPVTYVKQEIDTFIGLEIDYKNRLFVGNVHLVGPHHKILDFALSPPNSSTLMGMSYVHASKVMKKGLRLDDLFNDKDTQVEKLRKELGIYSDLLSSGGKDESMLKDELHRFIETTERANPEHIFAFFDAPDKVEYILDLFSRMVVGNPDFPERRDIGQLARDILKRGGKLMGECAQSYWLSNAVETHWRSSTSAQTHAAGSVASLGINRHYREIDINIFKTPGDSRVGIGSNPSGFVPQNYFSSKGYQRLADLGDKCIDFDSIQRTYFESIGKNGILEPQRFTDGSGTYIVDEAMAIATARTFGECGSTTGKPRVTGIFDAVAARHVCDVQGPYAFISALDRGDSQDYVGITVAYVYHHPDGISTDSNGKVYENGDLIRIGEQYPNENVLEHCYPIIKVMRGWKDSPIRFGTRKFKDPLPETLQEFLGVVEELTQFRIMGIGNGPDEGNVIYLKSEEK